jgi:hypothetical protein
LRPPGDHEGSEVRFAPPAGICLAFPPVVERTLSRQLIQRAFGDQTGRHSAGTDPSRRLPPPRSGTRKTPSPDCSASAFDRGDQPKEADRRDTRRRPVAEGRTIITPRFW